MPFIIDAAPAEQVAPGPVLNAAEIRRRLATVARSKEGRGLGGAVKAGRDLAGRRFVIETADQHSENEGSSLFREYNPTTGELSIEFRPTSVNNVSVVRGPGETGPMLSFYDAEGFKLTSTERLTGGYVGQNAFGVSTDVSAYAGLAFAVGQLQVGLLPAKPLPGEHPDLDDLRVTVPAPPEVGRVGSTKLRIVAEGTVSTGPEGETILCSEGLRRPTLDSPIEKRTTWCSLIVKFSSIKVRDEGGPVYIDWPSCLPDCSVRHQQFKAFQERRRR